MNTKHYSDIIQLIENARSFLYRVSKQRTTKEYALRDLAFRQLLGLVVDVMIHKDLSILTHGRPPEMVKILELMHAYVYGAENKPSERKGITHD